MLNLQSNGEYATWKIGLWIVAKNKRQKGENLYFASKSMENEYFDGLALKRIFYKEEKHLQIQNEVQKKIKS